MLAIWQDEIRPIVFFKAEQGVKDRLMYPKSAKFSDLRLVDRHGERRVCGKVNILSENNSMIETRFIWQSRINFAQIEDVFAVPDCAASGSREEELLCSNNYPDPKFQLAWLAKC